MPRMRSVFLASFHHELADVHVGDVFASLQQVVCLDAVVVWHANVVDEADINDEDGYRWALVVSNTTSETATTCQVTRCLTGTVFGAKLLRAIGHLLGIDESIWTECSKTYFTSYV